MELLRLLTEPQQLRRRTAEDLDLVGLAEAGRREHMADRIGHPGEAVIRAYHDVPWPDLGREMAQRLGREDHRVAIELRAAMRRALCYSAT